MSKMFEQYNKLEVMTPEKYFRKWSENCRMMIDYEPIHSHEDMMQFAKDYHAEKSTTEENSLKEVTREELTLEKIKYNLSFGNEAQAVRCLEQYAYSVVFSKSLELNKAFVSGLTPEELDAKMKPFDSEI